MSTGTLAVNKPADLAGLSKAGGCPPQRLTKQRTAGERPPSQDTWIDFQDAKSWSQVSS